MGVIVEMKRRDPEPFSELLGETLDRLEAAWDALHDDVVNLACTGPWAAWSEAQSPGSLMRFEREALRDTGDARITALCDALDTFQLTLNSLAAYRRPSTEAH